VNGKSPDAQLVSRFRRLLQSHRTAGYLGEFSRRVKGPRLLQECG
jgi:hypothetical protein